MKLKLCMDTCETAHLT